MHRPGGAALLLPVQATTLRYPAHFYVWLYVRCVNFCFVAAPLI